MHFSWPSRARPALILAPMEGVTDAPMRALMSERGGFTFCVSEFLRVTQDLLPAHVFHKHVPEFNNACRTPTGLPVQIQLLGGDPELMAQNANRACELGARAIDINFGCPSPTVNRHDGGATLLKFPHRIRNIVASVRAAVPKEIPVSAKLRLGWDSVEDIYINSTQAALGGASWITIHARTKMQGYQPPVYWKYIGDIRKQLDIPVVANGDIWTLEDFRKCREMTLCEHFMIGRGALANPALPLLIAQELGIISNLPEQDFEALPFSYTPAEWRPILKRFSELCHSTTRGPSYTASRIKQWLRMAHMKTPLPWFDDVKKLNTADEIFSRLH